VRLAHHDRPEGGIARRCLFAVLAGTSVIACSDEQAVDAPAAPERAAYELLFGEAAPLSTRDKAAAFAALETIFSVSADGSRLEDPNCGDIGARAETVDLNGDGVFEIFLQWGNTCTSGMAGRSIGLLVRNAGGDYQFELGFPAAGWLAMDSSENGWPDLSFGVPGFCQPVWARTAGAYQFKCSVPQDTDMCLRPGEPCPGP
jgi:hypothetical protein